MELTIDVPKHLEQQLLPYRDRLPELLTRGVKSLESAETASNADPALIEDENDLIQLLARRNTPQTIVGLTPATQWQVHIDMLLKKNKQGLLSNAEQAELDRILFLEEIVGLLKANALIELAD